MKMNIIVPNIIQCNIQLEEGGGDWDDIHEEAKIGIATCVLRQCGMD